MLRIKKIKFENWKNFPKAEIALHDRLFVIGPNASGKSNFLDIFRFLRDISQPSGGGLREAVDSRGGVGLIRRIGATSNPNILINVELEDGSIGRHTWEYTIRFNQDKQRIPKLNKELVKRDGVVLLDRPDNDDKSDSLRLTQTSLEQVHLNKDFRPILEFFQGVSYHHLIPQVVRDPHGFSPHQIENDPYGRDFLQRIWKTPQKSRGSRLNKIANALKSAIPRLESLEVEQDANGIPHLKGRFENWRTSGVFQSESQFSDGTLRLFGLLWSLFEGEGLLLMEEPELSLHPEVVRRLPEIMERVNRFRKVKRQAIITTFSEEMLNNESIGKEEVLRLEPGPRGTECIGVSDEEAIQLKNRLTIADVILPKAAPQAVKQLDFFLAS